MLHDTIFPALKRWAIFRKNLTLTRTASVVTNSALFSSVLDPIGEETFFANGSHLNK